MVTGFEKSSSWVSPVDPKLAGPACGNIRQHVVNSESRQDWEEVMHSFSSAET